MQFLVIYCHENLFVYMCVYIYIYISLYCNKTLFLYIKILSHGDYSSITPILPIGQQKQSRYSGG